MIAKIVYYCWFGEEIPLYIKQRVQKWQKVLTGYEFVHIGSHNFDYTKYAFTRDAFEDKQFAFVADVARLEYLLDTGGVYLDTDVEVCKDLTPFLAREALSLSMERYGFEITGVNVGTIIAPHNHPVIKAVHEKLIEFTYSPNRPTLNEHFNDQLKSLKYKDEEQIFEKLKTTVYQAEIFTTKSENSYTIHHFENSWGKKLTTSKKIKRIVGVQVKKIIGRDRFQKIFRKR